MNKLLYLLWSTFININEGARILGVFPFPAPSHSILGSSLMKGLAEAGHDVTIISPFSEKTPPKDCKWTEIILEQLIEETNSKLLTKKVFNPFAMDGESQISTFFFLDQIGETVTRGTLKDKNVQKLLRSNEEFDVVITTQFIYDAMKAFASHFNAYLILFSSTAANSWWNHLVGNPSMPSFAPEMMLAFPDKMSFCQRLQNSLFKLVNTLIFNFYLYPKQNQLIQEYFPNPIDINDVLYNVSLVLVNSHESMSAAQPRVPCMIDIGGFHVQPPKKLPEDLQTFLDDAKEGVIYFSMGSNLKSKNLPEAKRNEILKAFGKRKEKILWKWEDDVLPDQPRNVKVGKWLPQQDILAHPNVKLFITHGGFLSSTETVYHGVPIVAIPIAGDQKMNAANAKQAGYAIVIRFEDLSEETLSKALDEILTNPSYTNNVKERSRIMKDRQIKPLDNAIYWVEYVIRHNGAKHLRVPYLELSWYQFYMLDVILFIITVILIAVWSTKKTFSYLCRRTQNKNKSKTE